VRAQAEWPFQKRNLTSYEILVVTVILLLVWWTFFSRAANRLRLGITFTLVGVALAGAALFRLRGMTGDMMPIVEFRWGKTSLPQVPEPKPGAMAEVAKHGDTEYSFPQFYGPNRDGVLAGPKLDTNWGAHPPQVLWRVPVGAGWSGFVVVGGDLCLTQEQRGEEECVVARELASGIERWRHTDAARYHTTIAGEGPRATPTVVSNRVFTFGSTGLLNCLDLASGKPMWQRDVMKESGGKVPQWGATSSPLLVDDLVVVHGGEGGSHSLFAYRAADGTPVWKGGASPSYSTPILATLAGVPQVLAFDDGSVSGLNPKSGATLWQRPWGNGNVVCASPLVVGSNRVLFSSGYGVGAELLELAQKTNGGVAAEPVWKSIRMKAKFAHMFVREGCVFGLDDGMFACVDLQDGAQKWKEGRYGHGQGVLVGDLYLLMAEAGELVLLRPTSDAPNELARFRVFNSKTWNPIALAGDLLLVRNDQEAVCIRLKLGP
jgi:outer membrane protein assembly factor BamB